MHLVLDNADVEIVNLDRRRLHRGEGVAHSMDLPLAAEAEDVQLLQGKLVELRLVRHFLLEVEVRGRDFGLALEVVVACNLRKRGRLGTAVVIVLDLLLLGGGDAVGVLVVIRELFLDHLQVLLAAFVGVRQERSTRRLRIGTICLLA